MKFGKYLISLATTNNDMHSEFSYQYSHMPYDEAQQYRKFLLSLKENKVERFFEKIDQGETPDDIDIKINKANFIAFLKELRRPEDDIDDFFEDKKERTRRADDRQLSLKLNIDNKEKLKDLYSTLERGGYIEKGYSNKFINVFTGKITTLGESERIPWLLPNHFLRKFILVIKGSQLFLTNSLTKQHWKIVVEVFKTKKGISENNIQSARGKISPSEEDRMKAILKSLT